MAFFSHLVSPDEIKPDPKLLSVIRDILPPIKVKDTRSYLGLVSYYCHFVPGFAKIAEPLHVLLHKGATWEWTNDCQTAFQTLKDELLEQPVAAYPDFNIAFRLYTRMPPPWS